ncbi:ABC transporter permease [Candidatus Poribacteria bacterium]|nr:ABC transporter permease [Candidatus Poribacteria bacterium]MYH83973.1 ABC transporter permease [Candidatus Poribacteria bacterium]MYK92513.1 ABC transporter permease [Candidatus Poribacteria bacterium]
MWLILVKLAWRNIFRNKRRTIIAATAIGIGLAALIFVDALMIGMTDNMVRTATASFLGDAQIHRAGFRDVQEVSLTIQALDEVIEGLAQEEIVEHFTQRVLAPGMITSPANVSAIALVGVHPPTEKFLSQIDDAITEGVYFEGGSSRDIVIGAKLAEILEIGLGDRVVVTVAQAETGDLSQEMFRISGIYYFADEEMNARMAFVQIDKAREMLGIGNAAHEIAIKFTSLAYSQDPALPFWETYSRHGNEALSWTELMSQLTAILEMTKYSKYIMAVILFFLVAFGIINTLFMSLYERMFEFGVLRAVGTRPFGMARVVLFEAGALAIVSIGLGAILGFVLTAVFAHVGIDYTGIEMTGVTIQEFIRPTMKVEQFIIYPVWLFIFTIIAGLYPARHAAKISPATAMRRSF